MGTTYPAIRPDGSLDPDLFTQGLNQVYGSGSSSSSGSSGSSRSSGSSSSSGSSRSSGSSGSSSPPGLNINNSAAGSDSSGIIQQGFGGATQWDTIKDLALSPTDYSDKDGFQYIGLDQADAPGINVGEKLSAMSDAIDRISAANASLLKGEIPADVASAVRRAASESSLARGIFGSSARNLSARDLGKTSVDIKQQGISNESALLQSRNELAASYEAIRQYNLTRNTALANLSLESRKLNLTAIEQERMRIATNIDANIKILGYIAEMAIQQQSIATSAAANEIDPSNIISALDAMMAEFNEQLS